MTNDTSASAMCGNSRREFISTCAALSSLPLLAGLPGTVFAAGASDRLRVGVVGCGGRGIGAVHDALAADPAVQVWAIGDIFQDQVDAAHRAFTREGSNRYVDPARYAVPEERRFSGFDAFRGVIHSGIDIVILASPPHFRPQHMEEAVKKGVHIFAEKPVAVDPAGARKVIEIGELAKQKKLAIVAGTQRRHSKAHQETMARIQDGAIGTLVGGQCYWVGGELWHRGRKPEWTEMEYQIRNWLYFTWLSGDHIVEQHVHNIDIMNWAFGGPPVKAFGMGGRQRRTDPKYGDAWDHFSIEYEYANGVRVQGMCRQSNNTTYRVNEHLVGTLGTALPRGVINGKNAWRFREKDVNPYVQEHVALIQGIRNGTPLNEARSVAESTLTAILGRMSAYTGKEISYNWVLNASKLDLTPPRYEFGEAPPVVIPIPGTTQLV